MCGEKGRNNFTGGSEVAIYGHTHFFLLPGEPGPPVSHSSPEPEEEEEEEALLREREREGDRDSRGLLATCWNSESETSEPEDSTVAADLVLSSIFIRHHTSGL